MEGLGQQVDEEELKEMVAVSDTDGSGEIDFPEFLGLMARKMKDSDLEDDLNEAFRAVLNERERRAAADERAGRRARSRQGKARGAESVPGTPVPGTPRTPRTPGAVVAAEGGEEMTPRSATRRARPMSLRERQRLVRGERDEIDEALDSVIGVRPEVEALADATEWRAASGAGRRVQAVLDAIAFGGETDPLEARLSVDEVRASLASLEADMGEGQYKELLAMFDVESGLEIPFEQFRKQILASIRLDAVMGREPVIKKAPL